MVPWQKRARLALAVFGIALAIVVYAAIGEREKAAPVPPPDRLDPKAVIESSGNIVQEVRGTKLDFVIQAEHVLTYEGGRTKLMGVEIKVRERAGRDFIIAGREAQAGEKQKELQLTGDVKLTASDGFEVTTDHATFNEDEGIVRAPDAVMFRKGRMSGSGVGMAYDKNVDLLSITDESHVKLTDEHDKITMEFFAGHAVLSRPDDLLTLERNVHVLRDQEVLDADRGTARFSKNEEYVTLIELRGNAQAKGSNSGLESMKAADIDLDYTEDGAALERVALRGGSIISMNGQNGAPGRVIRGETLDLMFAPDGAVTQATGREKVELQLPATNGPAHTIRAAVLEGTGEPGKGLTAARFATGVEYREEDHPGNVARTVRSNTLRLTLMDDSVASAVFAGQVRFEEQGLRARGAEARYDPGKGTLQLLGADAAGRPQVSDDQVNVDADTIELALNGPRLVAAGNVKTTLQPEASGRAATSAAPRATGGTMKLPGLLKSEQAANVSAESMDYQGASGNAVYKGEATLWQGETAIRADAITLDQGKGNLLATGNARSTIMLSDGASTGRAAEIRFDDAARQVSYSNPKAQAPARGRQAATVAAPQPQLSGPQGDLRADRIELILEKSGGGAERVEAYTAVNVRLDTREATGARLTFFADEGRYQMAGASTIPVKVVEECREITGKTLTFFKSTDRIIVDGNEEIRTKTRRGAPCSATPPR